MIGRANVVGRTWQRSRGATSRMLQWLPLGPAAAGMGVSAYLSFVHFSGLPVYCSSSGGCHVVQSSEYATLLTVPVSLLGFLLYVLIFAAGAVAVRGEGRAAALAPFVVFGLALSGTLYSAYLTWLEVYRIYAVCAWCVTSAVLLASILLLSTAELIVSGRWRDLEPHAG